MSKIAFAFQGGFAPEVRVCDSGTASGISNVLASCHQPDREVLSVFKHVVRVVDSDALPANHKAEKILGERVSFWQGCMLMQIDCFAHKLHLAAVRCFTMPLSEKLLIGLTNVALALTSPGQWVKAKRALNSVIAQKLEVIRSPAHLPKIAHDFRKRCLQAFAPPKLRASIFLHVLATFMLNGDWRSRASLVHYCTGCCSDRQQAVVKTQWLASKVLTACKPIPFCSSNWTGWSKAMHFAIFSCMHGLLHDLVDEAMGWSCSAGCVEVPHDIASGANLHVACVPEDGALGPALRPSRASSSE